MIGRYRSNRAGVGGGSGGGGVIKTRREWVRVARERAVAGHATREELAEPASLAAVAVALECQEEASYKRVTLNKATVRTLLEGFCSGSGVMVKEGGNAPRFPPRGGFVVVVVVAADKESGGNERDWRRHGFSPVGGYAVVKMRRTIPG